MPGSGGSCGAGCGVGCARRVPVTTISLGLAAVSPPVAGPFAKTSAGFIGTATGGNPTGCIGVTAPRLTGGCIGAFMLAIKLASGLLGVTGIGAAGVGAMTGVGVGITAGRRVPVTTVSGAAIGCWAFLTRYSNNRWREPRGSKKAGVIVSNLSSAWRPDHRTRA